MIESSFEWLAWIPFVPIGVAISLLPISGRAPRSLIAAASLLAVGGAVAVAACTLWVQLQRGAWSEWQFDGFVGVLLVSDGPTVLPRLVADPLRSLAVVVVLLGGGLSMWEGLVAAGGGERKVQRAVSAGVLLAELLVTGLIALLVLARSFVVMSACFCLVSVVTTAMMTATRPTREGLDASAARFLLHRVGDACLILAIILFQSTFGEVDIAKISTTLLEWGTYHRLPAGPFAGFYSGTFSVWTVSLCLLAVATRLMVFPVPNSPRRELGAPAPTLGIVHHLGAVWVGLFLLLQISPLLFSAPVLFPVLSWVAVVTLIVRCGMLMVTTNLLVLDLLVVQTYAALGVLAVSLVELTAASLVLLHLALFIPILSATGTTVIEYLQGCTDITAMGGLWKRLRRTDTIRSLLVLSSSGLPGFVVFFALERIFWESLAGPFQRLTFALGLLLFSFALPLAVYRSLYLVFSGEQPRQAEPLGQYRLPMWRWGVAMVAVFFVVASGFLFAASEPLARVVHPGHQEPFLRFLEPAVRHLLPIELNADLTLPLPRVRALPVTRTEGAGTMAVLALLGFLCARYAYRNRTLPMVKRMADHRVGRMLQGALASELGVERFLHRLVRTTVVPVARIVRMGVYPVVLDGLVVRSFALASALARGGLSLLHTGDIKRALLVAILLLLAWLSFWGAS